MVLRQLRSRISCSNLTDGDKNTLNVVTLNGLKATASNSMDFVVNYIQFKVMTRPLPEIHSGSVSLGWGPRVFISAKFLGAAGPKAILGNPVVGQSCS